MDGDSIARLAYLGLLGAAVVAWFISQNRQGLNKTLQMVMAWVFIFVGVVAVIGLWEDLRTTVGPDAQMTVTGDTIEVPRASDGHYYLPMQANGRTITFMVDTGASQIVLSPDDAKRLDIDLGQLNYFGRAATANGVVRSAPVHLDSLTVGPFSDSNISVWVTEGDLDRSLLGMDYLQKFPNIQFSNDRMILSR